MTQRKKLRVAIVGRIDSTVVDGLTDLPGRTQIDAWSDPYADFDAIRAFRPDVLVVPGEEMRDSDLGVLRLLREAIDGQVTVFATPRARELEVADLARRAGAHVLATPCAARDVATVLGLGEPDARRAAPSAFFDIARGLADEVNNPLMFVSGHLQLLIASLDPEADADKIAQCEAIQQGLDRVGTTMAKLRAIGSIQQNEAPPASIQVGPIVERALASVEDSDSFRVDVAGDTADLRVRGEPELLESAVREFHAVARDLAHAAGYGEFAIVRAARDVIVRAWVRGERLDNWEGQRSFEPYYLSRVLRGSPHGLGLFLVQSVATAFGGRAIARRRKGELTLEVWLKGE